jgi:hypothetical protein
MFQPLTHELAVARRTDLDRQIRECTRHSVRYDQPARRGHSGRALKERAGWALIHAGLRLTGSPAADQP